MQADDIIEPERRRNKDEWGFCSANSPIPFPQPEVKAFHRDEIILTYFSYRKSLAFNKLMYLLEFIL